MDVPYFLSKYDPDPLRFYLTATASETRDTEFSWEDFVERNNLVLPAPACPGCAAQAGVGAAPWPADQDGQVSAGKGNELVACPGRILSSV